MKEYIKLQSRYREDENYSGGSFIQKGTEINGNILNSISRGEEGVIIEFEQ